MEAMISFTSTNKKKCCQTSNNALKTVMPGFLILMHPLKNIFTLPPAL